MLNRTTSAAMIAATIATGPFALSVAAPAPKHSPAHVRPAINPGPAVVRGFARTALHYLRGPAQRPFLNLLKSLPPQTGAVDISKAKTQNIILCAAG